MLGELDDSGLPAADDSTPSLSSLPIDVLENICSGLELRDRLSLTATCRSLWHRQDVAGSGELWGSLVMGLPPGPSNQLSRAAWLARHSGGLRSLMLYATVGVPVEQKVLASLQGSPLLQLHLACLEGLAPEPSAALQPLSTLTALTSLLLYSCRLCALPPALSALSGLLELELRGNNLGIEGRGLQDESLAPLRSLCNLRRLDLTACQLQRIPGPVGELKSLQELHLGYNFYLDADGTDGRFEPLRGLAPSLTLLDWGQCSLGAVPPQVSALQSLQALDLSGNHGLGEQQRQGQAQGAAAFWPLRALSTLRRLDLSDCSLPCIPQCCSALGGCLVELSTSSNQLGSAAWDVLEHLAVLTCLRLEHCGLQRLPPELASLACLQELSLKGNGELHEGVLEWGSSALGILEHMPALKRLDVRGCGLEAGLQQLRELEAAGVLVASGSCEAATPW